MNYFVVYTDGNNGTHVFEFDTRIQVAGFLEDYLRNHSLVKLADFQVIYGLPVNATVEMVETVVVCKPSRTTWGLRNDEV